MDPLLESPDVRVEVLTAGSLALVKLTHTPTGMVATEFVRRIGGQKRAKNRAAASLRAELRMAAALRDQLRTVPALPARWEGPSDLDVERVAPFTAESGSTYTVALSTSSYDVPFVLTPGQWADLVRAAAELGESFGQMP